MNYTIDIIDTQDNTYTTVLENAGRSSVVLSYKGSDAKDELKIVGSTLKFTIVVDASDNVDGVFEHLLTGDEQRYKVEVRKESDSTLIWQGFLLPDNYNEPYKNGTLSVDFTAVDGLGRLKGKFIDDSLYSGEYPVTLFIAECLKLTGLSMPFYFSPAIENYAQPRYDTIYIDGSDFVSRDKKDDAYKILEYLAKDLLFCVFQSMGKWHLEGINKRVLLNYDAYHYSVDGIFVEALQLSRNVKVINNHTVKTPNITTVVPYGIVSIEHERTPVSFKSTQSKENNDGWAVTTGVNPEIYSTQWLGAFYPKAIAPDYNIIFYNAANGTFNSSQSVSMLNKIYLQEGDKYKISLSLKLDIGNFSTIESWINAINYKITLNDNTLFSNFDGNVTNDENLYFDDSKSASVSFEFVVAENGLLDVVFYQPYKDNEDINAVLITDLKIEPIGFVDTETFTDVISEDYTKVKDVALDFSDDPSGFGKCFRLQPLDQNTGAYNQVIVPILYSFTQNGKHYSAVQLDGANLIKENRVAVFIENAPTGQVLDVVYNYLNGEQMLVETDTANLTGNFFVRIYYKNHGDADRTAWLEWTDAVYGVERLRFADVYAKVCRRLFNLPHEKVDLTITYPVLFNDIVVWNYKQSANYTISNLRSWNLDTGKTTLTINKAVYQNDGSDDTAENLPPFVSVPEQTIYITNSATSVNLESSAGDPDGFIASYLWSQVTAEAGVSFTSPNTTNTTVTGLSADFYTFQILVTDNGGATATATVNVVRINDFALSLTEVLNTPTTTATTATLEKHYNLVCTPALPDNFNLAVDANMVFDIDVSILDDQASARLILEKNTVELVNQNYVHQNGANGQLDVTTDIPFNYNNTDSIVVKLYVYAEQTPVDGGGNITSELDFNINDATFASGLGNITNSFPINVDATVTMTP